MNTFLDDIKTIHNLTDTQELNDLNHFKNKITGISVKFSNLNLLNISFIDLLRSYKGNIIIDAEFVRLDIWIKKMFASNKLTVSDKNRIFVTVQAKRRDAKEQILNLHQLGIKIILVMGNNYYLDNIDKKSDGITAIYNLYNKFENIALLGISNKIRNKIEKKYKINITENTILELYGEQKLITSSLWVYYCGKTLSQNAFNYLQRRKTGSESQDLLVNRYLVSNVNRISEITNTRGVILFVDGKNKDDYYHNLNEIQSFIK